MCFHIYMRLCNMCGLGPLLIPRLPLPQNQVDCFTVVLHIQPVPDVTACAVHRQRPVPLSGQCIISRNIPPLSDFNRRRCVPGPHTGDYLGICRPLPGYNSSHTAERFSYSKQIEAYGYNLAGHFRPQSGIWSKNGPKRD